MAGEIVAIKIIPDGVGAGVSPGGSKGGGPGSGAENIGKSVSKGIDGVLKALGIASLVGILVSLVAGMKTLLNIVSSLFKLVNALLRPIELVISTLLMPILFILKPLVILANQIMAPFIKLALNVMREGVQKQAAGDVSGALGAFAAAGNIALSGLSSVLVVVSSSITKIMIDILFQSAATFLNKLFEVIGIIMSPILQFFGFSAEEIKTSVITIQESIGTTFTLAADILKGTISTISGNAVIAMAAGSKFLAESFGVETNKFREDARKVILNTFVGAVGLNKTFDLLMGTSDPNGFGTEGKVAIDESINGATGLSNAFLDAIIGFENKGKAAVKNAVDSINSEWDFLRKRTVDRDRGNANRLSANELLALSFGVGREGQFFFPGEG